MSIKQSSGAVATFGKVEPGKSFFLDDVFTSTDSEKPISGGIFIYDKSPEDFECEHECFASPMMPLSSCTLQTRTNVSSTVCPQHIELMTVVADDEMKVLLEGEMTLTDKATGTRIDAKAVASSPERVVLVCRPVMTRATSSTSPRARRSCSTHRRPARRSMSARGASLLHGAGSKL